MIKFAKEVSAVWINGDDPAFDSTELGSFTDEQRKTVSFEIAPLTASSIRAISKKHTKKIMEFENGRRVVHEQTDDVAVNNALLDHIVTNWKGVSWDGEEAEAVCNLENKLKMSDNFPSLAAMWVNLARTVATKQTEDKEQSEKN